MACFVFMNIIEVHNILVNNFLKLVNAFIIGVICGTLLKNRSAKPQQLIEPYRFPVTNLIIKHIPKNIFLVVLLKGTCVAAPYAPMPTCLNCNASLKFHV